MWFSNETQHGLGHDLRLDVDLKMSNLGLDMALTMKTKGVLLGVRKRSASRFQSVM